MPPVLLYDQKKENKRIALFFCLFFLTISFFACQVVGTMFFKTFGKPVPSFFSLVFPPEKIPFEGKVVEYLGLAILTILAVSFFILGLSYLIRGKLATIILDSENSVLTKHYTGFFFRPKSFSLQGVKKITKKRKKGKSQYLGNNISILSPNAYRLYLVYKNNKNRLFMTDLDQKKVQHVYTAIKNAL